MSEFWGGIPGWLRFIVALLILGSGLCVILFTRFWRAGAGLIGLGLILIVMSEKSRGEKGGYNF